MRLATLNLFNNPHGRWADREPLVVEQGVALDADVFCFQEVVAGGAQLDRLLDALGAGYVAVPLDNPDGSSIKSLAIVTRLAVVEHDACLSLEQGDIALRVRVETEHGAAFDVVTTHFHWDPSREGSDCRRRQAEQLVDWLGEATAPTIVAGDFNSRPGGGAIAVMKTRFRSAHETVHGDEPRCTHPTPLLRAVDTKAAFGTPIVPDGDGAAVDFVFVSDDVNVTSCELAWTRPSAVEPNLYPSDHFGLVADLVPAGGQR